MSTETIPPHKSWIASIRAFHLIWFDAIAGLLAGLIMLTLHVWLADIYAMPRYLLVAIAFVNLAYGTTSLTFALTSRHGRVPWLRVIAVANLLWTFCCIALAVAWFREASPFGMAQLIGEGFFVGVLGVVEWRVGGRELGLHAQ